MGIFNPDTFLDEVIEEKNEIVSTPIPLGIVDAFIESLSFKEGTSKEGRDWVRLDVKWNIQDDSVRAFLDRENVTITQGIYLDVDSTTGRIATGRNKNIELGVLREAVGKNDGPLRLRELEGQFAKIEISHRDNPNRPGQPLADVKRVMKR